MAVTTFLPFASGGNTGTAKLLVLGPASAPLADRSRSLNLEHVSAADLSRQEISRRTSACRWSVPSRAGAHPAPDETILAPLRRWFWARKPDAGFVLSDFPATLLQAHVFDEWLEARGSSLTGVLVDDAARAPEALLDHYCTRGVDLFDAASFAA